MLTKDQAIKDLDYIIKTLSERHPACMNGLPELVLQVYQKEKEELPEQVSVLELWHTASRVLAAMKDGHTQVLYHPAEYHTLPVIRLTDGKLTCTGTYDNEKFSMLL